MQRNATRETVQPNNAHEKQLWSKMN